MTSSRDRYLEIAARIQREEREQREGKNGNPAGDDNIKQEDDDSTVVHLQGD